MEAEQPNEIVVPKPKKRSGKLLTILIVISIFFFLSCGALVYYILITRSSIETQVVAQKAISDKEKFKLQLENLENEYNELGKDYDDLDSSLMQEKEKVRVLIENVNELEWTASRYKNEISKLEINLQKFKEKIRDLESENKKLSDNTDRYKFSLDSALYAYKSQQQKVVSKDTKKLKAERLTGEGIRINKKDLQETPQKIASKVEKLKICFRLSQNFDSDKGLIAIYLRVTDPQGLVVSDLAGGSGEFTYNGKEILYSQRKSVYYENKAIDMCMYLQNKAMCVKGVYYVDVFVDDYLAGTTTFALE